MTTILPGSVCANFDEFRQEFQVQKKENVIIVLRSAPSQTILGILHVAEAQRR